MSYCRLGNMDSDVYMYLIAENPAKLECCACALHPEGRCVKLNSRASAVGHLLCHIEAGDRVPQYAIDRLVEEIREEFRKEEDQG